MYVIINIIESGINVNNEINVIKRKEIIMSILLVFLILSAIFIVIFVYTNKNSNNLLEEKPSVIDENNYITLEDVDVNLFEDVYKNIKLNEIKFVNINEDITSNYYSKQNNIIETLKNNVTINKERINLHNKNNNITEYVNNSSIDSIILFDFKDNILSLLYLVEEDVDYFGLNNYIANLFINVTDNTIMNNDDIISNYNLSKQIICSEVYDNIINYHSDSFKDKDTGNTLTKEEISNKSDKYINMLIDNFDKYIYFYLNDGNLYLKYNKHDISNFLFNENLYSIKYSTMKLEM